jgi:hypothetical protein
MARMYDCKYVYEMLPGIYAWPAKAAFRDHNVWGNELNTKQSTGPHPYSAYVWSACSHLPTASLVIQVVNQH